MNYHKILENLLNRNEYFVVGKNIIRSDALDKCLGKAKFTADYITKDSLIVNVYRSSKSHAIIKNIETSHAMNISGVEAIITAKDVPGINQIGYALPDQPLLNDTKVHYIGDPIALICAQNEEAAQRAEESILVEYEDLETVFDIDAALKSDAPIIHKDSNVAVTTKIRKGDIEKGFKESNVIIEDSPIGQNSLPVLKRSDLKINEICLFSTIFFGDELVPTRNFYTEFEELFIPRGTILLNNNIEYYTIFDIIIDPLNSSADYTYILYEVTQIPALVTNYGVVYDLFADNLIVTRDGLEATYKLNYKSTEVDSDTTVCKMTILETGAQYDMINDSTAFTLLFTNNLVIPNGEITYYFTISHPVSGNLSQYSNRFIFRKDLEDFTISNVVMDSTSYIVYDIPTIKKSYYDSIDQRVFETQVLQTLLTTLTFKDYRMLTDFVNFKFANTSGILNNMQLNSTSLDDVIDILSTPPLILENEDRFIVLNGTGIWENRDNEIATYLFDGTTEVWVFTEPSTEQMIYVQNQDLKYIYGDFGWIVPSYNIPLNISLDVFVLDNYTGSISNLIQSIKEELLDSFSTRFGINTNIYRSEIIDVVQSVEGVKHCRLLRPESSIFFNFNIDNFSQEELLQYSPEYVYFTEDTITVRIV